MTSAPPGSALERIRCAAASEIAFAGAKRPWRTGKGGCRAHEVPGCEGFILALSLKPKAPGTLVVALLSKGHGDRLTRKGSLSLVAVSERGRALSFWPNKETPPPRAFTGSPDSGKAAQGLDHLPGQAQLHLVT